MVHVLERLEDEFAETIGTKYAVITGSGRLAMEIALKAIDIKAKVIIPNLTCSVVPYVILKTKSIPFVADIDNNLALDLGTVESLMDKEYGAIMPVYLYGCPADDLKKLNDFAQSNELMLIEDAAQSFGARYKSRNLGSYGDLGIFSLPKAFFDLIRGGAITTNDKGVAKKAKELRKKMQQETSQQTLSLLSRKYQLKGRLKGKIGRITKSILEPSKSAPEPDRKKSLGNLRPPYQIFDEPYFYEHLTELEVNRAHQTLEMFDEIRSKRLELAKILIDLIEKIQDFELIQPYNDEFAYTRIPVYVKSGHLAQWIAFFEGRGIRIDMVYAPLSKSNLLREKCEFLPEYKISEPMSRHILPLPVDKRIVELLG